VWMYVGGNPFAFVDPWGMAAEDNPTGGRRGALYRRCGFFACTPVSGSEITDRSNAGLPALPSELSSLVRPWQTIHDVIWTDATEERYQRSTELDAHVQVAPLVDETMNQIVEATPQAAATTWLWFVGNVGTAGGVASSGATVPRRALPTPATSSLPAALRGGAADVHVYFGVRNRVRVYVGITNNMVRRARQHGTRFRLEQITTTPVTRGQARAIEQALIVRSRGFENRINSISPTHSYYAQAVRWGEAWLSANGILR
jgi:hypothetical protein